MAKFGSRLRHAFNAFVGDAEDRMAPMNLGQSASSYSRPDRPRARVNSERTIISSIYTRIAIDVSGIRMEHVRNNANGQYQETIMSGLNDCLNVGANIDQAGRHFRFDMALSLLQLGRIAVLPIDTTLDPRNSGNWDIRSMRVGEVLEWYPRDVKVRAYDERTGQWQDIIVSKSVAAIVENPFCSVMNEPNSTLQRLIHKLSLMDKIDEISSQGKLDIIIQLPYVVKTEARKKEANDRRTQIEEQLRGSTYGIAYTDGTEKITQLNRAIENNLLDQIKYLTDKLYTELGLTPEIMDGTADDVAMTNYMNRTIEPLMDALVESMLRTFITKTARTQGQSLMYFQTPFKLIPMGELANLVDVLSRNQIVTPNEIRPALGLKPSTQPQADQLVNSNMPIGDQITGPGATVADPSSPPDQASIDETNLDKQMAELGVG